MERRRRERGDGTTATRASRWYDDDESEAMERRRRERGDGTTATRARQWNDDDEGEAIERRRRERGDGTTKTKQRSGTRQRATGRAQCGVDGNDSVPMRVFPSPASSDSSTEAEVLVSTVSHYRVQIYTSRHMRTLACRLPWFAKDKRHIQWGGCFSLKARRSLTSRIQGIWTHNSDGDRMETRA